MHRKRLSQMNLIDVRQVIWCSLARTELRRLHARAVELLDGDLSAIKGQMDGVVFGNAAVYVNNQLLGILKDIKFNVTL